MVVDVAMLWSVDTVCMALLACLCTLSASAFIEPSLHHLDIFLEIFLWKLYNEVASIKKRKSNCMFKEKFMLTKNDEYKDVLVTCTYKWLYAALFKSHTVL